MERKEKIQTGRGERKVCVSMYLQKVVADSRNWLAPDSVFSIKIIAADYVIFNCIASTYIVLSKYQTLVITNITLTTPS